MTEEQSKLSELPKGWVWTNLGFLAKQINPGFPSGKWKRDGEEAIPHLRPMNIDVKGDIDLSNLKYVSRKDYDPLLEGDILFNNTNSPKLLGKTAVMKKDTNWAYSNHMTRIRLVSSTMEPAFVSSYLQSLFAKGFFQMHCVHHVNQASVNTRFLAEKVFVPIPPLAEQKRIVDKLEELFTRLDAGVESLRNVKAQLQLYRQAVLKHAFNGKLTEEWRRSHKDKIEPVSEILKHIKNVRKQKVGIFKKIEPIDSSFYGKLPKLPHGWIWTRLGEIIEESLIGLVVPLSQQNKEGHGTPYVKMNNITADGRFNLEDVAYVNLRKSDLNKYLLKKGDILINTRNSYELVGKTCVVDDDSVSRVFNNNILRIKLFENVIPSLFSHQINSPFFKEQVVGKKRATTNVCAFYVKDVINAPIMLMPTPEQKEIAEQIEKIFSVIDETEETVERNLVWTRSLRQSILKIAFEGKLVAHDPRDEPADVLVERIREEKERQSYQKKKTRSRRKSRKMSQRSLNSYVE